MKLDNDFSDLMHESKFEKFKPFLKRLAVLAALAIVIGGAYLYFNSQTDSTKSHTESDAKSYEDSEQAKCISDVYEQHKTPNESDPDFYPKLIAGYDAHLACYDKYPDENSASNRLSIESARQSAIDASGDYKEAYLSSNSNASTPNNLSSQKSGSASSSTYDPSKCEPLNSEASRLKQVSDQKKVTYDNAFTARKNYGYFYEKHGNSIDAQRAYDAQEAQLNLLQTDWQDALNKQNAAYSKYQECRASL